MRIWLSVVALLFVGCGPSVGTNGNEVGAACTADNASTICHHVCLLGSPHYPGRNTCTEKCTSDDNCASGSACVSALKFTDGNFACAVVCTTDKECAGFGDGYSCATVDREGESGQIGICWVATSS